MNKWLYDPENDERNGTQFLYNLPIHEDDFLFHGFTYRELMDVVIANCGHNVTEEQFYKELKSFLAMRLEDVKEGLMLCEANMLKKIRGEQ